MLASRSATKPAVARAASRKAVVVKAQAQVNSARTLISRRIAPWEHSRARLFAIWVSLCHRYSEMIAGPDTGITLQSDSSLWFDWWDAALLPTAPCFAPTPVYVWEIRIKPARCMSLGSLRAAPQLLGMLAPAFTSLSRRAARAVTQRHLRWRLTPTHVFPPPSNAEAQPEAGIRCRCRRHRPGLCAPGPGCRGGQGCDRHRPPRR